MARISGVDLPREKRVEIGLTYIYGIGVTSSNRILSQAGVDPNTRVKDLTDDEVKKIAEVIAETQVVEGDRSLWTSSDSPKSAAIAEFAIVRACPFAVRRPRRMQEPAKARRKPLLIRRSNFSNRRIESRCMF